MTSDQRSVGLRPWQWIIVLIIALVGGVIGGYLAGGVNITIMESDIDRRQAAPEETFEVDEDD